MRSRKHNGDILKIDTQQLCASYGVQSVKLVRDRDSSHLSQEPPSCALVVHPCSVFARSCNNCMTPFRKKMAIVSLTGKVWSAVRLWPWED